MSSLSNSIAISMINVQLNSSQRFPEFRPSQLGPTTPRTQGWHVLIPFKFYSSRWSSAQTIAAKVFSLFFTKIIY